MKSPVAQIRQKLLAEWRLHTLCGLALYPSSSPRLCST